MDIISLLEELEELMDDANSVPFSKKVSVNPEDVYGIISDMKEAIPQEIKDAQWVNSERERILTEANSQADAMKEKAKEDIKKGYDEANRKIKQLVSEHNITVEANAEAEKIVSEAKTTAQQIATNSLAYVDQLLTKTSDDLKNTLKVIDENRSQLKY